MITSNLGFKAEGIETAPSLNHLPNFKPDEIVFVIGGGEVYRQLLPHCQKIFLTEIDLEPDGDAYFPELPKNFKLSDGSQKDWLTSEKSGIKYRFLEYVDQAEVERVQKIADSI